MTAANNEHEDIDRAEGEPVNPVAPEDACPNCGERACDELVWIDDERVECQRCKHVYLPQQETAGKIELDDTWLGLLKAAEALLEARDDQMVTVVEWRALRRAAHKCRRYKKAARPGGSRHARGESAR